MFPVMLDPAAQPPSASIRTMAEAMRSGEAASRGVLWGAMGGIAEIMEEPDGSLAFVFAYETDPS